MSTIRVLLVDDHRVVAAGLQLLLEKEADIEVLGIASDGAEALQLAQQMQPDVVVMDVNMHNMDGVTAARLLRDRCSGCQVLLLTGFDNDLMLAGLHAGALGYMFKDVAQSEFVENIRSVARGELVLHPDMYPKVIGHLQHLPYDESLSLPPVQLTEREVDVLRLVQANVANHDIATRLGISRATVKTHLTNAYNKLAVRKRELAVKEAQRRGLL